MKNRQSKQPDHKPWPYACGNRWCLNGPPGKQCETYWLCDVCSRACTEIGDKNRTKTHFSALLQLKLVVPLANPEDGERA